MSISIATLGKFWPQLGGGTAATTTIVEKGGGNYAGGVWERKQPTVVIDKVVEREDEKISVIVMGVEDA